MFTVQQDILSSTSIDGDPLILDCKKINKAQVAYFIYKVKVSKEYVYDDNLGRINTIEGRLRVCRKLLSSNIRFVKDFMRDFMKFCKEQELDIMSISSIDSSEIERLYRESLLEDIIKTREAWKVSLKMYSYKGVSDVPITEQEVTRAKNYPITDLIKFNCAGFAPCIFHSEKTGSMKYYKGSNSVHCFGCKTTGDSIKVAQQLFGENFINTVKRLI